jgi:hypothetical protein
MTRIFSEENPLLWMLMTVKAARGALDEVARLASHWFQRHLARI